MFNLLQKIGKALMTPIAVLPIAAILLRLGFGDIPFINGEFATILKSAGEVIFANLDLLFGIGIAYGLAKNSDGTAGLSGGVGVIVAKSIYINIDSSVNMGVFVGIIMGVIAGTLYNRFYTIKFPEYLGFFSGKRFIPIVTVFSAILVGILAGYFWQYAQNLINSFSSIIISLNEVGTFIYGVLNRALIPLGLHHILNSIFWFQLGEYTYIKDGVEVVANGDLHRFFAGDKTAGIYMSGFYIVMMFGLPSMALAIYLATDKKFKTKAKVLLFGVAFTSFLTGITEPLEFMFLFIAPPLFLLHSILTGLALATAQYFNIYAGFGFSAGFIDFIINYKLSTNAILIIPLGVVFGFIYFILTFYTIKLFKFKIIEQEIGEEKSDTKEFIDALGGEENIIETDSCITRLRMNLKDTKNINEKKLKELGAKGVITIDKNSLQVVLGTNSQEIAEEIKEEINN